jgi:3-deoxy-D-manno-octulosonic acid (KDO) 8-phosphate synthase
VPGKLLAMTLLDRCTSILGRKRRIQQVGLMPGRSTVEQIFTMRQLIENMKEFRRKACVVFVDFKAAFDLVDRNSLWMIF